MRIMSAAIDIGGHYAAKVYEFTKSRYIPDQRYVFAIKGASVYNQPIVVPPSKKQGAYLFVVGTDTAKDHIHECLKTDFPGAGYVHFPLSLPEAYFHQLCSESKVTEWHKGKRRKVWKNSSRARNEALDTFVYAICALYIMQFYMFPNKTVPVMLEEIAKKEKFSGTLQRNAETVKDGKTTSVQGVAKPKRRVISKGVRI
jgi:phage terminase large subunit GpA-like protein